MTTLSRITFTLLLGLLATSCNFDINMGPGKKGNGVIANDTRSITENFNRVSVSEGLDVYITQADDFEITIEADENIIDLIQTDIKNGRLKIHARENIGRATKKIFVSMPVIAGLSSSSGADLETKTIINADEIDLDASSGADLVVSLKASYIDASSSSGADIKISGETEDLNADASSGANINAKNLKTKTCEADASSGAGIRVDVSEKLVADASSGGDITYTGSAEVTKNKSVSGSVRKR